MGPGTAKTRSNTDRTVNSSDVQKVATILQAMLADCLNNLPLYSVADFARDCNRVNSRLRHEGISFATLTLPSLSKGLLNLLEGRPSAFPGFTIRDGVPVFMRSVFLAALNDRLCQEDRAKYVGSIYQISVAYKKLQGPYHRKVLAQQWEEFCDVDRDLERLTFSDSDPILKRARHLCRNFIQNCDPLLHDEFVPRPGPGATNEPTSKDMRYEPHVLYTQIDEVIPYVDHFYPTRWDVINRAREYMAMPVIPEPTSRFKFVPKYAGEARGICIEENEVQMFQQALRRVLTSLIDKHPLYKRRIVLKDQSVNGWLAHTSSFDRLSCTIDMSSASDRIARSLVEYLFQDSPEMLSCLLALSTRMISPPHEVKGARPIRTHKFAPMGSAICFPIMSLVHMFLLRAIAQVGSDAQYPHYSSAQIFVYGDDVVMPSSLFSAVCEHLPKYGMVINEKKSFVASHFRESCGRHAYYGVDVTPTFIRCNASPKASHLRSLLEAEYLLYTRGWFQAAKALRTILQGQSKYLRRKVYVYPMTGAVGVYRDHIPPYLDYDGRPYWKRRFNRDLQCYEWKVPTFHSIPTNASMLPMQEGLMRYWCFSKSNGGSEDPRLIPMQSHDNDESRVTVQWRWSAQPT